jgi:hypothetical protein
MRLPKSIVHAFCTYSVLVAIVGCASGNQQLAPAENIASLSVDGATLTSSGTLAPIVFASNLNNDVVGYSQKTGSTIETLSGFNEVDGLATDRYGSLYVPSQLQHAVFVYPYLSGTPSLTLSTPSNDPTDVAVSRRGQVCVVEANSSSGVFSLAFFKKGASTPFNTLSVSFMTVMRGCAYDANGNVYVTGFGSKKNGAVGYLAGGGHGTSVVDLNITSVAQPSGLQVAKNGNVLVGDQSAATIHEFQPDSNNEVGRVLLDRNIVEFALTRDNKHVWATDNDDALVTEFNFPGGGSPRKTISAPTLTQAVAVTPWSAP